MVLVSAIDLPMGTQVIGKMISEKKVPNEDEEKRFIGSRYQLIKLLYNSISPMKGDKGRR